MEQVQQPSKERPSSARPERSLSPQRTRRPGQNLPRREDKILEHAGQHLIGIGTCGGQFGTKSQRSRDINFDLLESGAAAIV